MGRVVSADKEWKVDQIAELVREVVAAGQHAATVGSVVDGVIGIVGAQDLRLHRIGASAAAALGTVPKHATKQVDRFLSKSALNLDVAMEALVRYLLAERTELLVALDWTEFDADDQSTLRIYLLSGHGRALPLLWKSVVKSEIEGERTAEELTLVRRLAALIPPHVSIILMADCGFGYQEVLQTLHELGMEYVIRVRGNIELTTADGVTKKTGEWLAKNGRARKFEGVAITKERTEVPCFLAVRRSKMKSGWLLVSSLVGESADTLIRLYGKRFSIEETFRDQKDDHFGLGLRATHIRNPARRDRLLLLCALAYVFILTLGQAGEDAGLDRLLKVNTSKTRQLSLFNQGLRWLELLPGMREEWKTPLIAAFLKRIHSHDFGQLMLQHLAQEK